MTTTVKITSHNYPVLVRTTDFYKHKGSVAEVIQWPEDGELTYHATTTRTISCVDLEYDDHRAESDKKRRAGAAA